MYVRIGKKVYSEAEIEAMSVAQISELQQHIKEQQLFTSNKVDAAKVLMSDNNPIEDRDYFAYKKKLRILNSVAMYLKAVKKEKNIEMHEARNDNLIRILHDMVGEDKFQEACALVRKKES